MSKIDPDRERRVIERGEAFSLQALDLAASQWAADDPRVFAEALEYLVEAIIQFAIHHKDPQPIIALVIDDLSCVDGKQRRANAMVRAQKKPQ